MMGKGNMAGLLKQAQKLQQQLEETQANLANIRVEGSAGGGMVIVSANAAQEVIEIRIDPEVINPEDAEMLEDMVLAAVNQALANAKTKANEEMAKVTGGMMPGLGGLALPGF